MSKLFLKNMLLNNCWQLYMRSQDKSEMLPPKQATLNFKIKGSYFVSKIWHSAD